MVKKDFPLFYFIAFIALGILAKYVYTFDFTIPLFPQISMNLVALPSIITSLLFGPLYGGVVGGLVDILGHLLHPTGPYLPQVTLMAVLRGLIPGLLFQHFARLGLFKAITLSISLSQMGVSVLYGSIILADFFEQTFVQLLISRSITQLFSIPLFSLISYTVLKHHRTDQILKDTNERYRSLVDNVPEAIFRCQWDDDWTMTFMSDSIGPITGYLASDFLDNAVRSYNSIIHPEDREYVQQTIGEHICQLRPYSINYRLLSKEGTIKWVHETGRAVYSPQGEVEYIDGTIADITELKEAEERLRASEEKYRSIVEVIPDIIIRCNREGEYLDIYASSENLLVFSKDRLLGKRILDVLPKEQGETFMESVNQALSNQSLETTEYELFLNNSRNWFEARLLPVSDEELVALIRNITRRKEAEEKAADYLYEVELQNEELILLYERLDEEIDRARTIHRRLLEDNFPEIQGLSIVAYNREATYIGGDFYNVIKKGHTLVLYVSDVTGHGLDGALFSTFVKNTVLSYIDLSREEHITPENILRYLDTRVRNENYPSEYAVALFLMVLDLNTFEASYSGVGFQNPPVIMSKEAPLQSLISEGLPITPDVPVECMDFSSKRIQFSKNQCLFLSTDGLYEQRVLDDLYEERLLSLLERECHLCQEDLKDSICKDFKDFLGNQEQDDDVTFLILGFEGDPKSDI